MEDELTPEAQQILNLSERLAEAEDTLRAVRSGEIDAFIVQGPTGDQIYALRSAEQPYRHLVEDMLEGAAILTAEGDIAYCNRRFAELICVPQEEVVGGSMERYIGLTDRPAYRNLLVAGSGKRRAQLRTADGKLVDVLMSFTTSMCDDVERRNLIITDLSELLDAQSGRDRAEQQSQAKDEFMAMLAHELRNPLSAITAAVQVLETAKGHEKASSRARFIIGRQAHHLSRLVDDLLDVSRVVTGKIALDRHAIDFCELVRRAIVVFTERETHHHFDISVSPAWIRGDTVRVEQIVSNIIGNAVKYTPSGGRIGISLSIEGNDAVLRVQDTGFGIAPELLPRIFDLFVQGERTLDRAQGGLGIGLTLVQRLVKLHDETVSIHSDGPDRGSLFTVRLPRVAATVRNTASSGDAVCTVAVKRRVLIIEDNRDAREMFRMMLELDGHEVLEAEEGCAGLQLLLGSAKPDIAFVDVGLPGLDGYEIARRYRGAAAADAATAGTVGEQRQQRALLVALTGYGTPDALERSQVAGFDHHLIKPVNPEALYRVMNGEWGCCGGGSSRHVAGGDSDDRGGSGLEQAAGSATEEHEHAAAVAAAAVAANGENSESVALRVAAP